MDVQLNLDKSYCVVTKEAGDKRYYSGEWSEAESTFLYHVKKELIKQGFSVVKTRMWKDGHLVSDTQQYLKSKLPEFYIYNSSYAIYDLGERFNDLDVGEHISISVVT